MSHQSGGLISEDFIQSLLEKADIVQLIQQSIPLKKAGANFVACCPFHQEKSPSFTVTPSKQFYHCFGCGVNGDAISFLRAYYNLNFIEAVERLANHLGVALPKSSQSTPAFKETFKPYFDVLEEVAAYYQQALKKHPQNDVPIAYLKGRGLEGITAKTFRLGYAPPQWDNLVKHFGANPEKLVLLEKLGLIIRHEKGHYFDRFRHRIMFPIRHRKGDIIGFGGRAISPDDSPKYMNSPESVVFKKGQHLYGHFEAQSRHQEWKKVICVEGYFDVIGLYQAGVLGAMAPMGTALTEAHVKRLFQISDEITFCFDGDKAGRSAAWRALELLFPNFVEQKRVKFLFLPEGDDPDSYIRDKGKAAFMGILQQSLSLSEYFFSTLCERFPPDNVENRAELIRTGRRYIDQMPKSTYQNMMMEALAQLTSTSQHIVSKKYDFLAKKNKSYASRYQRQALPKESAPPPPLGPAYIASGLLMVEPKLINLVEKQSIWEYINVPGLSLLRALADILLEPESGHHSAEETMSTLLKRGFTQNLIKQCISKVRFIPQDGRKDELLGALDRLLVIGRDQLIADLLKKSESRALDTEEKNMLKKFLTFRESSGDTDI